ncbi:MAG: hypothetical protein JW932_08705 [Deltaproteobacteria bacterium]|nr:hypothetical protein [Deltaproteobacteria bacterium]
MKPIILEVVAPTLSGANLNDWGCCLLSEAGAEEGYRLSPCDEYPEDWKEAVGYVSQWMKNIRSLYRHRIVIEMVDAQSPLGIWKQIRHRVFRFPAFIIDKKSTYIGWDPQELEALIDRHI